MPPIAEGGGDGGGLSDELARGLRRVRAAYADGRAPAYAAATASGTCTFMTTAALAQALQLRLGVHTGTRTLGLRVLPSLLGMCTVAAASIASVEAAAWAAAAAAAAAVGERVPLRRVRATHGTTYASSVVLGGACFLALGGRFRALSPSSLSSLGAFANTKKGSLPATLAYATRSERSTIQELGRRFGCHTCGARPWPLWARAQLRYNADHMPPLAEVKVMNQALWRRVLSAPVRATLEPLYLRTFGPPAAGCALDPSSALSLNSLALPRCGSASTRSARAAPSSRPGCSASAPHWPGSSARHGTPSEGPPSVRARPSSTRPRYGGRHTGSARSSRSRRSLPRAPSRLSTSSRSPRPIVCKLRCAAAPARAYQRRSGWRGRSACGCGGFVRATNPSTLVYSLDHLLTYSITSKRAETVMPFA